MMKVISIISGASKSLLVSVLVLGCSIAITAQTKVYSFQGDTYTEREFKNKLAAIKTTFEQQGSYKYTTVSYKLLGSQLKNDTVFNNVEVVLSQSNSAPLDILKGVQELIDQPLPDFKLQNLDYKIKTQEDFKGKVTLINLWFTTCRPCITELPYLNYLADTYRSKVNFTAITFNNQDTVRQFLERRTFNFEQLVDAGDYIDTALRNNAFPKLILLDKQGVVRFVANGVELSGNTPENPGLATTELEKQINYLLNN